MKNSASRLEFIATTAVSTFAMQSSLLPSEVWRWNYWTGDCDCCVWMRHCTVTYWEKQQRVLKAQSTTMLQQQHLRVPQLYWPMRTFSQKNGRLTTEMHNTTPWNTTERHEHWREKNWFHLRLTNTVSWQCRQWRILRPHTHTLPQSPTTIS